MMVGFVFPHEASDRTTPYDFVADPKTGIRPGVIGQQKPSGYSKVNLQDGIGQANLPPLAIWEDGMWVSEITGVEEEQKFKTLLSTLPMSEQFDSWLVSGEGTPGNFAYRVYLVPKQISATVDPKHPLLWPENLKRPKMQSIYTTPPRSALPGGTGGWAHGGHAGYESPTPVPKKPVAKAAPALPAGLRIRCPGCGHWWKESGLAAHVNNCCPGKQGFKTEGVDQMVSDWAILCECCDTLDEVSTCKPGFPRPVAEKPATPDPEPEEVKPDEEEPKEPQEPVEEPVAAVTAPA